MGDFRHKKQKIIGLTFMVCAIILFADKAVDLGAEAVPVLGEIMLGVVFFTVGYAFLVHPMRKNKDDENGNE